jgi:Domain of unknown function (DUF4271)
MSKDSLLTSVPPDTSSISVKSGIMGQAATGKSIFEGHLLKPVHDRATFPEHTTPDWLTITLFSVIVLFTWYKLFYNRMFLQLVSAFFSMATTNQMVRDESVLLQRASLNASLIFYLAGGLFLYQVSIIYQWNLPFLENGFTRFLMFSFVLAILYSSKMLLIRILSNIFSAEKAASGYIFTIFLFNMMAGLMLLPIIVLIAYAPVELQHLSIVTALILLAGFLIYRMVRVAVLWMSIPRAPVFYLFLYLCAFEVAPLLLIRKIVLMQV